MTDDRGGARYRHYHHYHYHPMDDDDDNKGKVMRNRGEKRASEC